jgi:hypothetical protein
MRQMIVVLLTCLAGMGAVVAAGPDTHLGQPASQLITLIGQCDDFSCQDTLLRAFPDGTMQTCPGGRGAPVKCDYRVPDGMVLVVTDVNWTFKANPGARGNLGLFVDPLPTGSAAIPAYWSQVKDDNGVFGVQVSDHLTSGFVVSSKARIRPQYSASGNNTTTFTTVLVRGYLVADK